MISPRDSQIDAFLQEHLDRHLAETVQLCAQPSVSATGEGVLDCADLVLELLSRRGLEVHRIPTAGYPVIVGQAAGRSARTLLFYNHYDVQPPGPLELWDSPPFEPQIREGALFARGAADDKGEFVGRLAALDAVRAANGGELPCGVIFVVEGEEERGSPHIARFVEEQRDLLACDGAIWEVGEIDPSGRPVLVLGYRGILAVELSVRSMASDAHSGHAHRFPSAAWRLIQALETLKDGKERIRVEGFYDRVRSPTEQELAWLDALPDTEALHRELYGIEKFAGGRTGRALNRAVFEPTANISGLIAGYAGPGFQTVIPAQAVARLDFRLVPDQDPDEIFDQLQRHLDRHGFGDVGLSRLASMWPARTAPDDPLVRLAIETGREVYGQAPVIDPLVGASSPVYAFARPLGGIPVISAGVRYWDNRVHAPNEHIRVRDFLNGARHIGRLLDRFATAGELQL